jgi:3-deoxy-D-arabino-heptulosonate 7-phosphate (DAHP) synthase
MMSTDLDALPKIGAPATRALNAAGYTALRQLAGVPRAQLAALHGVGPKALDVIQAALDQHGLSFR